MILINLQEYEYIQLTSVVMRRDDTKSGRDLRVIWAISIKSLVVKDLLEVSR
jgi:hypothetical protein